MGVTSLSPPPSNCSLTDEQEPEYMIERDLQDKKKTSRLDNGNEERNPGLIDYLDLAPSASSSESSSANSPSSEWCGL